MALWGGRFSGQTDKELTGFSESVSFDKRLYKYDIMGSKAHAAMLAEQGIIPRAAADAIAVELDEIEERIDEGDFKFSAELEDIHMHIENALIEKLGDEGARVHSARSRNDQIALDIRLYLRDAVTGICAMIRDFQRALVEQAAGNGDAIMPGFTHLQHAQPVLFGHHLLAYVEMLERDIERLEDCSKRINVMPLGSGALAGSTLKIDREEVCRALNFSRVTRNSMDAVADRDFIIEFISDLAIFAMHVSRLSEDIILWCSQEFSFVELDDAFCTGSSLMPQKKNPDIAELSRGKTARVYGALTAILTLCKGLPLTYNRDLQEDKEPLFDAVDTVKRILRLYPAMVATMRIRREKMLAAASDPALMATDLAEKLVEIGVPFRNAHHRVGAFVKWCRDKNKALNETTLKEMRETIPEATAEFLELFSPESSVAKREITGATGPKAVAAQIEFWKKKLS
ncbi:MAG: argininosuccinate lyase [Victivallaceae bacterium]|nr:argininosuccinate lyase [Victivallaceae bacterium]